MNKEEENDDESYAYVSGYNVFLVILALFFIFGGKDKSTNHLLIQLIMNIFL